MWVIIWEGTGGRSIEEGKDEQWAIGPFDSREDAECYIECCGRAEQWDQRLVGVIELGLPEGSTWRM